MIANFFQSLKEHGVEYLLISGQATVLYGAATFSEDVDLWVNPSKENSERLIAALRACGGRFYKLTPPLTVDYLRRGHGFHFIVPGGSEPEFYLDVMGSPPRTDAYEGAVATARWLDTEWGKLHTIGLKELVELKKTQRLDDYPIISNLAVAWFEQPEAARMPGDFLWALENIFTLPALRSFFENSPAALDVVSGEVREFGRQVLATSEPAEELQRSLSESMNNRMMVLQQADRRYWRPILEELKDLRAAGGLIPQGQKV